MQWSLPLRDEDLLMVTSTGQDCTPEPPGQGGGSTPSSVSCAAQWKLPVFEVAVGQSSQCFEPREMSYADRPVGTSKKRWQS